MIICHLHKRLDRLNHLIVSDIVVIEKAVRKSITVYEQKRGR